MILITSLPRLKRKSSVLLRPTSSDVTRRDPHQFGRLRPRGWMADVWLLQQNTHTHHGTTLHRNVMLGVAECALWHNHMAHEVFSWHDISANPTALSLPLQQPLLSQGVLLRLVTQFPGGPGAHRSRMVKTFLTGNFRALTTTPASFIHRSLVLRRDIKNG